MCYTLFSHSVPFFVPARLRGSDRPNHASMIVGSQEVLALLAFRVLFLTDSALKHLLPRLCPTYVPVKVLMMMDEARESCEVGGGRTFGQCKQGEQRAGKTSGNAVPLLSGPRQPGKGFISRRHDDG